MSVTVTSNSTSVKHRKFLPENLSVKSWESIADFYNDLRDRQISGAADLRKWLLDRTELESVIQEDVAWRYIRMSCDTTNKEYSDAFNFFVSEIEPNIAPYTNELNLKLLNCPFLSEMGDQRMEVMIRNIRKQTEIFRAENIPLLSELQQKEQHFATIAGAMTINVDGKEITLQQASNYLKNNNRATRETVYLKIIERRLHHF